MADRTFGEDQLELDGGSDRQDELFDVLSHPRRRFALLHLQTADTPLPVGELADELLSWENQQPVAPGPGDGRAAVKVALVHNHLPKMDEAGFVRYDATRQMVTLGDRTDEVRSHLQVVPTS